VDAALADFRAWLTAAPPPPAEPPREPVDLHTLVAQFVALRQEVNLQTRAVRAQQEQTAEALKQAQTRPAAPAEDSERAKPLLKALVDVADAQILAVRELERVLAGLEDAAPPDDAAAQPPKLSLLARLAGAGRVLDRLQQLEQRLDSGGPSLETICDRLTAAVAGLQMGLQRLERTLRQHGLDPVAAVGQPFDPELMEVVDVAVDSGRPAGEVVEEMRRGYLWNGKVFRYAQVRVAK
jgi:molecular chaperone GrpE